MKTLVLVLLLVLSVVSSAFCSGLGDTAESIRAEYGKAVQIDEMENFGTPQRVGRLDGNARGLFGPAQTNPTAQQFFLGIRRLIPLDAKLIQSYSQEGQWLKEIYTFKSVSLSTTPNIAKAISYDKKYFNNPVGTFTVYVNYDIGDKGRVASFSIILGLPGEVDLDGAKKTNKNPLK